MIGSKGNPNRLWDLYNISATTAHDYLIAQGFSIEKSHISRLYHSGGEVFTLTEEAGIITAVMYKVTDQAAYQACIEYAKNTLLFETILEEHHPGADIIRLDDSHCTLFCTDIHSAHDFNSFGITLVAKLPLPKPENQVEIIMTAPPPR